MSALEQLRHEALQVAFSTADNAAVPACNQQTHGTQEFEWAGCACAIGTARRTCSYSDSAAADITSAVN
jgi:hypothetical protein